MWISSLCSLLSTGPLLFMDKTMVFCGFWSSKLCSESSRLSYPAIFDDRIHLYICTRWRLNLLDRNISEHHQANLPWLISPDLYLWASGLAQPSVGECSRQLNSLDIFRVCCCFVWLPQTSLQFSWSTQDDTIPAARVIVHEPSSSQKLGHDLCSCEFYVHRSGYPWIFNILDGFKIPSLCTRVRPVSWITPAILKNPLLFWSLEYFALDFLMKGSSAFTINIFLLSVHTSDFV